MGGDGEMSNEAAVLYGVGDLRVEARPVPVLKEREVLVEIRSVGVCGSDVHYFEHGRIGDFVVRSPLVLGHESSGVVVARGAKADAHELGERVALEPGVPCGTCRECRSGRYNLCKDIAFFATPPVDGSLARYVAIDEDFAHHVPEGVSDDAAALCEPLSVGIWACEKAGVGIGSAVVVAGAGPIGAVVTLVARAAGASSVVVSDPVASRRERVVSLGASGAVDPSETSLARSAGDADVFIDCTGQPAAIEDGIEALRPAGAAVLVGMGPSISAPLPVARIQAREIVLTGTFRYAHTYPKAIDLVASGRVDLDALVDATFPLASAEEALLAARRDPAIIKAVVRVGRG